MRFSPTLVCLALAVCLAGQCASPALVSAEKSKTSTSDKHNSKKKGSGKKGKKAEQAPKAEQAQKTDQADDPAKQFLGTPWGAPTADMKGLTHVEQANMVAYLKKDTPNASYLGVPVAELVAVACRGKLAGALIRLGSDEAYAAMEKALAAKKGEPGVEVEGGGRQWDFGDTLVILKVGTLKAPPALSMYHSDAFLPCARAWDTPSYDVFIPSKEKLLEDSPMIDTAP